MTTVTTVAPMPVDKDLAERLRRAAGKVERWSDERDRLIHQARQEGGSAREIAEMVGLSHAGVLKIETRVQEQLDQSDD